MYKIKSKLTKDMSRECSCDVSNKIKDALFSRVGTKIVNFFSNIFYGAVEYQV